MVETAAFEQFWKVYPRKIGKLAALKAYTKARRIASAEDILAGVQRYIKTKPEYADYCHPTTFLNAGRWMDEPDATPAAWEPCAHTPRCASPQWCLVVRARARGEAV